jgi:predicted  nucleic acid-binding Zn-ribbon protein
MNMTLAFQIAMALVAFFGGLWVNRLQSDIKELRTRLDNIRDTYVRREDSGREYGNLVDMLKEVKSRLENLDSKLDRKADKTGHVD